MGDSMSKSLNARCIRRWEVEFKPLCDSKVNPYWRKRDLRGIYPRGGAHHSLQHGRDMADAKV